MAKMGRAAANFQRYEQGGPDRQILDGIDVSIAFESRVKAGGRDRSPTSGELQTWKRVLVEIAQSFGAWAKVDKAQTHKRDGLPSLKVVTFNVPRSKQNPLRSIFSDANFQVGGVASVTGFQVIGEVTERKPDGTPLKINPMGSL